MSESFFRHNDRYLCYGYKIIGMGSNGIIVPLNTSKELSNAIGAAVVKVNLGYSSIDYVLRKYTDNTDDVSADTLSPIDYNYDQCARSLMLLIDNIISKRMKLDGLPDIPGLVAAGASFLRMQRTWGNYLIVCNRGAKYDSFALLKIIFEQLAWIYTIYEIGDSKFFEIQPSKCVGKLREIDKNSGKIYGHINEYAHISTKVISEYTEFTKNGVFSISSDKNESFKSMHWAFRLVDYMGIINEIIWRKYYKSFEYRCQSKEVISWKQNRPSFVMYKKYKKVIPQLD